MSTPKLLTKLFTENGYGNKLNSELLPETSNVDLSGVVKSVNGKTPDGNGAVTVDTGVTSVNGSTGAVTLTIPDISTKVNLSGSRGSLAGYETTGAYTATITQNSPDATDATGNVTVNNGSSGTTWTKVVRLQGAYTVTLGSSWAWQGGEAPTISANGVLVLNWINTTGVACFVSRSA